MFDQSILVPLDGSELSEKAIPYAVSIARATRQPLRLLTVWEGVERELGSEPSAAAEEVGARGRALRQVYLTDVAQRVAAQGVEVVEEVRHGDPSEELLRFCDEHAPALLVMATHGRSGIQRMWYGSVASKLMRAAPVPTLLVGLGPSVLADTRDDVAIKKILVPLDGSHLSESALQPAAILAEAFGARLVLARAVRWPAQGFADLPDVYLPEIKRELTEGATGYLAGIRDGLKTPQHVQTHVLEGLAAEAIQELVARERIDLVVMTSHGRGGVGRFLLGSVADRVIHGTVPVLLIRPEVATALPRYEPVRARYCHHCGRPVRYGEIDAEQRCLRCQRYLHVCANCVYSDLVACLLQRPEAHDTYPGVNCPKFQFHESVPPRARAAAAAARH
jgi:nucleotide-binding universal stress UspA family protein